MISKAELKNYFRKLGNKEPEEELRKQLGLVAGIPPPKNVESDGKKISDGVLESDRKGLVDNENYDTARSNKE